MRKCSVGFIYVRQHAARHRKSCQAGIISCPDCKYLTCKKARNGLSGGQKRAPSFSKQSTVCLSCEKEFSSNYSLQQHRRKELGAKQRRPSDTVADLSKIVEEEGEDGEKTKLDLSACQHFVVDTEMENGRHEVFNFQMSKLDNKIIVNREEFFNKLNSAVKNQYCS